MKFKSFFYMFFITLILGSIVNGLYLYLTPHYTPKVSFVNLLPILEQSTLTPSDYDLLFQQTGLSAAIINELKEESDFKDKILNFQKDYLADITVFSLYMPPATFCQITGTNTTHRTKAFTIAPYHKGYILLTNATHTLGWRHGHCGLVVDEVHGLTLEALSPNTVSCLQNIHKWEYYPTFKMMRLKNAPQAQLNLISDYALANFKGLPYNILVTKKQAEPYYTHCALLIWQVFDALGYDLVPHKSLTVFPKDIACSPLLEVLQIYGFDPNKDW